MYRPIICAHQRPNIACIGVIRAIYCMYCIRLPHVKGVPRVQSTRHPFSPSMTKRHRDSTRGVNTKFKKQKGVKVRTVSIPDSDEEGLPSNVETEYARLLKTRATTSGKVDGVTMNSLTLFEAKAAASNDSLDPPTGTCQGHSSPRRSRGS